MKVKFVILRGKNRKQKELIIKSKHRKKKQYMKSIVKFQ